MFFDENEFFVEKKIGKEGRLKYGFFRWGVRDAIETAVDSRRKRDETVVIQLLRHFYLVRLVPFAYATASSSGTYAEK